MIEGTRVKVVYGFYAGENGVVSYVARTGFYYIRLSGGRNRVTRVLPWMVINN